MNCFVQFCSIIIFLSFSLSLFAEETPQDFALNAAPKTAADPSPISPFFEDEFEGKAQLPFGPNTSEFKAYKRKQMRKQIVRSKKRAKRKLAKRRTKKRRVAKKKVPRKRVKKNKKYVKKYLKKSKSKKLIKRVPAAKKTYQKKK